MSYCPPMPKVAGPLLALLCAVACSTGPSLPRDGGEGARFPLVLLPSPEGDGVVVAGANFDRSHRAGTLRVIDTQTDRWVAESGTEIPSFAASLAWLPQPGARNLVVAARENDALSLVDLPAKTGWAMTCGNDPDTGACDAAHTLGASEGDPSVGNDPMAVVFQPAPEGGPASAPPWLAHVVATSDGRVSLFGFDPGKQGKPAWTPLDTLSFNNGLQEVRASKLTGRVYVSDARLAVLHIYHVEPGSDASQPAYRLVLEPALGLPASSPADYGRGLALSQDEATLYVAWRSPNAIAVLDVGPKANGDPRNQLLDLVPLGASPSGLALAPTGPDGRELLYVACYGADGIWVVDPKLRAVIAKIGLPHAPYGLTTVDVPGLGWKLYAGVFAQHKVAVIPLAPGPQQHTLAGFVEAP
jgi:hypothetical protein